MTAPVPVTLIGGYLGAGKTTLLNHLLRHADGRRLAVLVNEFGSLSIDADLIVARDDNLISISGGCICCSFGSDLVAALIDLRGGSLPIDQILIETSGVALPASIVRSLGLLPGLVLDGVIVVADAETIEERAARGYMSDTVRAQLDAADMIVLNKIDLVSPEHIAAVRRWLAAIKSEARVLLAKNSEIAPDVILGRHLDLRLQNGPRRMPWQGTEAYDTLEIAIDTPVDPEALSKALTDPRLGLLRAKGFVPGPDRNLVTLHVVGHRASVEPAPSWIDGPGRLVCIGLVKHMDRVAIVAAIRMAGACRPTDLQDQTDNSRS